MPDDSTVYTAAGFHEHVLITLHQLQQSQQFCDLTLKAKDGQIKVHSLLLLASSTFFQQWYTNQTNKSDLSFWIPELSVSELKLIVEYFYTGKLVVSHQSVLVFTTLFERLWVEQAVTLCHQFVVSCKNNSPAEEVKHSETMKLVSISDNKNSASPSCANDDAATSSSVSVKNHSESRVLEDEKSNKIVLDEDPVSAKKNSLRETEHLNVALLHSEDSVKKEQVENIEVACEEAVSGGKRKPSKRHRDNPVGTAVPKSKRGRKPRKSVPISTSERKLKCKELPARGKNETRQRRRRLQAVEDVEKEAKPDTEMTVMENTEPPESDSDSSDDHTVKKKTSRRVLAKPAKSKKRPYRYRVKKRLYPCEHCGYVAREKIGLAGHEKSKHQIPFDSGRFTILKCQVGWLVFCSSCSRFILFFISSDVVESCKLVRRGSLTSASVLNG